MANIPPTITPAPEGPQRGDRATFAGRVDAFITWMIAAVAQFGTLAANVYANAVEAYTQATAAASSAAAAKVAADSALTTAGITGWVSGTTYAKYAKVFSPITFKAYVRKVAGAGATDPSADTTNWGDAGGAALLVFKDIGTANTLDYSLGNRQSWAPNTGAQMLTITNWPATPQWGELLVRITNPGGKTLTSSVAITWHKPDRTTVSNTSITTNYGLALVTTGTERLVLWREEDGSVHGKFI